MCGIFGLFVPDGAVPPAVPLAAVMGAMRHRGPDGDGQWVSDDRRYLTAFARLAIIDLQTGDQPLVDEAGPWVLSGNGEIYNYLELRGTPAAAHYPFKTQGDMEAVFPLVDKWGMDFVDHLNGMFALALYNRADHQLVLVRDRLGIKPLYWAELGNGGIVYASEVKTLFASGLVHPAVDEQQVSAYLAHGYVPGPATIFKGVSKLQPGERLSIDRRGNRQLTTYWRPAPGSAPPPQSIEAAAGQMIDLLRDSVRLQLRSDVPVGALLSGGLDSGLLVALASEESSRPVTTFTVRFEGASVDESPLAAEIAERYGTDHHCLELPMDDAADVLPSALWYCDEPVNDAALLPNLMIERELSKAMKVALNGTGGDELFCGYGRYFQLPVERRYLSLPRVLRRHLIEPVAGSVNPFLAWQLQRAEKFYNDRGAYLHDHATHFPEPVRRLIGNRMTPPAVAQRERFPEGIDDLQTAGLIADMSTYLPDDLLLLVDRTSMAVSVEGRVPFLDHHLVEAALRVPSCLRTAGNQQKALEREMASRLLPQSVVEAPKQGFASPVPAWLRAGLGETAQRILTRPDALDRGWWTEAGIARLLAAPEQHGYRLYTLLVLEMCIRIHVESPVRNEAPDAPLDAFAEAA